VTEVMVPWLPNRVTTATKSHTGDAGQAGQAARFGIRRFRAHRRRLMVGHLIFLALNG
jgi:cell division inhibitor SulA